MTNTLIASQANRIALTLRVGLGLVFVAGGWWKLSRAIDPAQADALVARYTADNGYINAFFSQYLFDGNSLWGDGFITPLLFLTVLSAFELMSGIAFLAGIFTRMFSFIYAFLLWSFVMALPVVTAAGAHIDAPSYFSPALLVQVRDIGLSGMCFALLYFGSGAYSVDQRFLRRGFAKEASNWNAYGLLLRLSVAIVFLVGGFFAGYDHIKSFVDAPLLLVVIGLILASGHGVRAAAFVAFGVILYYCIGKFSFDASAWNNFNAVKRELAYLAASGVLMVYGGGAAYRLGDLFKSLPRALIGRTQTES